MQKNEVEKMIKLAKSNPYAGYKADYGMLEKQAKKLKILTKPKRISRVQSIRPNEYTDSDDFEPEFFTTIKKSPKGVKLPLYFKSHIAK